MEINRNNYESFFLLYLDRELSPVAMGEVDRFLTENSDLKKEFVLLQQTIFSPEDIVFEPKKLLLRKEEHKRTVPMYWMRFAAAAVVLILAGWMFFTTSKNHVPEVPGKTEIAKANSSKQELPIQADDKNSADQTSKAPLNIGSGKTLAEKLNPENSTTRNKTVRSVSSVKANVSDELNGPKNLQSAAEQQNSNGNEVSDEPELAMKKANTTLDLQSGSGIQEKDSKSIAGINGMKASELMLTANKTNELIAYKYVEANEPDFKTDNAISVVTLNDNNKAIAGFFKKLTKRAPADETTKNTRKLRVSVFQISY